MPIRSDSPYAACRVHVETRLAQEERKVELEKRFAKQQFEPDVEFNAPLLFMEEGNPVAQSEFMGVEDYCEQHEDLDDVADAGKLELSYEWLDEPDLPEAFDCERWNDLAVADWTADETGFVTFSDWEDSIVVPTYPIINTTDGQELWDSRLKDEADHQLAACTTLRQYHRTTSWIISCWQSMLSFPADYMDFLADRVAGTYERVVWTERERLEATHQTRLNLWKRAGQLQNPTQVSVIESPKTIEPQVVIIEVAPEPKKPRVKETCHVGRYRLGKKVVFASNPKKAKSLLKQGYVPA